MKWQTKVREEEREHVIGASAPVQSKYDVERAKERFEKMVAQHKADGTLIEVYEPVEEDGYIKKIYFNMKVREPAKVITLSFYDVDEYEYSRDACAEAGTLVEDLGRIPDEEMTKEEMIAAAERDIEENKKFDAWLKKHDEV